MRHGADLLKLGLKEPQGQQLTVSVGSIYGGWEWGMEGGQLHRNKELGWGLGPVAYMGQ